MFALSCLLNDVINDRMYALPFLTRAGTPIPRFPHVASRRAHDFPEVSRRVRLSSIFDRNACRDSGGMLVGRVGGDLTAV